MGKREEFFDFLTVLSGNKVHSIKNIKPVKEQDFMKKLNKQKIKWIVKEYERRDKGLWTIGQIQKITPQHVCRVYRKYKNCKDPLLKKCGRKARPISSEERKIVIETYKGYLVGATMIELILKEKGIHMNHNRIHKIMLEEGLAKHEENKQKRRTYKCYERKHSSSLWHMDWFQFRGKWHILYEDDASRFVTWAGEFSNRNSDDAWRVLNKAFKKHGVPKQLHSDNDSTSKTNEQEGKKKGERDFQKKVKEAGAQQIFARRRYPQGNGKNEKLNGTIKRLMKKDLSFDKVVEHYNYKKPHWKLITNEGKLRTPYQAFLDKMRKKEK